MKKTLLALVATTLTLGAVAANATPEQDKKNLVKYFTQKYPDIKLDQYVYGALAFDKDSMAQYNSIMDFPPFGTVVDQGQKMWETPFKNGKTYASCFPNGGKNVAGNYPYFDDKANKVVTFEMAINECRVSNGEEPFNLSDATTIGRLTAYARTLSDGMKMNIKVKGPKAEAAYEAGKSEFYTRHGQLGFSCASCHVYSAGSRLRSELLSPVVGQATHWPVFRGGDNLVTLQMRYVGCNKLVRATPFKEGSEEYNNLEYFHSYISNGLPMKASVFRK
ncbi:sulfur oxidation c-type cytochrome SoxA [Sulfuriferula nivalis]|uniref:SoxAX cytochrome complex subunit A n=1 Tax=Sulfuriferula nivalis TaxID=2675298 RepID=A0A809RZD4_9PROT|nr:sulfur oxidation c-type cytochrome SoxA [Sulfuriferula nivalis]BBO99577.1 SoxAX cytochrome complex subunit A [Sulfuriferula nivalis]